MEKDLICVEICTAMDHLGASTEMIGIGSLRERPELSNATRLQSRNDLVLKNSVVCDLLSHCGIFTLPLCCLMACDSSN